MAQKFRIEGLKELDKALGQLPRATGKNVLRRVARKALEPIIEDAKSKVTVLSGDLRESLAVSTKLSRRQKALHKKLVRGDKSSIEMFAGAGAHFRVPQGILEEFGSVNQAPSPFLRPAWDAGKSRVLNTVKKSLGDEIQKVANRIARKKARAASRIG